MKTVLRESHIYNNATSTAIRTNLSNIDTYIATVGHDITKFNVHVKILIQCIRARGEMSTDFLANLFKVYKTILNY